MNKINLLKHLFIACTCFAFVSCSKDKVSLTKACETVFYYNLEEKVFVEKSPTRITIGFDGRKSYEEATKIIDNSGYLESITSDKFLKSGQKNATVYIKGSRSCEEVSYILDILKRDQNIIFANQDLIFIGPDKSENYLGLTDEFYVALKDSNDKYLLEKTAKEMGVTILPKSNYSETYMLLVNEKSDKDALEMANYFQETGLFYFSAPNFLMTVQMP